MSEPALKVRAQNIEDEPEVFVVRRPYRWIRHPWYLVAIMLFWLCVDFTSDRLLLNVLWTDWVCLGTRLEQIRQFMQANQTSITNADSQRLSE